MSDLSKLVPRDKFDCSGIEELKTITPQEVEPILGALMEWMQDINWPVARELMQVLPRFHRELIPHIKSVFYSDDEEWKCWTLCLLKNFPAETVEYLAPEIALLCDMRVDYQEPEGVAEYAIEIIRQFNLCR